MKDSKHKELFNLLIKNYEISVNSKIKIVEDEIAKFRETINEYRNYVKSLEEELKNLKIDLEVIKK